MFDHVTTGRWPGRDLTGHYNPIGRPWPGHGTMAVRLERVNPKILQRLNVYWSSMAVHASGFGRHRKVRRSYTKEVYGAEYTGRVCIYRHREVVSPALYPCSSSFFTFSYSDTITNYFKYYWLTVADRAMCDERGCNRHPVPSVLKHGTRDPACVPSHGPVQCTRSRPQFSVVEHLLAVAVV